MVKLLGAMLLALITTACQNSLGTPPAVADSVTPVAKVDTWDRSRQCADHADRLATRLHHPALSNPRERQVMGNNNHYNLKDGRCYVEITFFDPTSKENKGVVPLISRELYDGVEGLLLAIHTSQRMLDEVGGTFFCQIPDPSGDRSLTRAECPAVHKFIVERMTN